MGKLGGGRGSWAPEERHQGRRRRGPTTRGRRARGGGEGAVALWWRKGGRGKARGCTRGFIGSKGSLEPLERARARVGGSSDAGGEGTRRRGRFDPGRRKERGKGAAARWAGRK